MGESFISYTAHGVAESTLLKATKVGHQYNLVSTVDIDNGSVANIGDYVAQDKWNADVPAKAKKVVLILTAPKIYADYTSKMQEEQNFYNKAGELMRAYELQDTDRFTLSEEAFDDDATLAVGNYVYVKNVNTAADGYTKASADYKLTASTTDPNASTTTYAFVGKIYATADNGNYRITVLRNQAI